MLLAKNSLIRHFSGLYFLTKVIPREFHCAVLESQSLFDQGMELINNHYSRILQH